MTLTCFNDDSYLLIYPNSNTTNNNMIRYTILSGDGDMIISDETIPNAMNIGKNIINIKTTLNNQKPNNTLLLTYQGMLF